MHLIFKKLGDEYTAFIVSDLFGSHGWCSSMTMHLRKQLIHSTFSESK